jgi:hypothetical protein
VAEWWKTLPWQKILPAVVASLGVAGGGVVHVNGDHERERVARAAQELQITELMRHAGESCATIAAAEDGSAIVKKCASDGCRQIWVQGDGVVFSYFVLAGSRLPSVSASHLGEDLGISRAAYASGACVEPPENHGPPDHPEYPFEWLEVSPDGWQRVLLRFRDTCALERYYHQPSSQWSTAYRWLHCVH